MAVIAHTALYFSVSFVKVKCPLVLFAVQSKVVAKGSKELKELGVFLGGLLERSIDRFAIGLQLWVLVNGTVE
jgi:hypothetical protein